MNETTWGRDYYSSFMFRDSGHCYLQCDFFVFSVLISKFWGSNLQSGITSHKNCTFYKCILPHKISKQSNKWYLCYYPLHSLNSSQINITDGQKLQSSEMVVASNHSVKVSFIKICQFVENKLEKLHIQS
jgi:Zn-finger protein